MDQWTSLGSHRYRIDDGILLLETNGEFSEADLTQYIAIFQRLAVDNPTFAVLADVRRGVSSSPEVRKRAAVAFRTKSQRVPIVVVGASLAIRTIFTLFTNAQRLLTGTPAMSAFCADFEQAREWLVLKRAELVRPGFPARPPVDSRPP